MFAMEPALNPFVRYAAKSAYLINKKYIIAKDCRIIYIISGCGMFETTEKKYILAPNTLICYPYELPYYIYSDSGQKMFFYTINFDYTSEFSNITNVMAPVFQSEYRSGECMSSLNNELEKKYGQVIYIPNAIWAENTLEAIYRESTYRREGYRQMQSAYMKELLVTEI